MVQPFSQPSDQGYAGFRTGFTVNRVAPRWVTGLLNDLSEGPTAPGQRLFSLALLLLLGLRIMAISGILHFHRNTAFSPDVSGLYQLPRPRFWKGWLSSSILMWQRTRARDLGRALTVTKPRRLFPPSDNPSKYLYIINLPGYDGMVNLLLVLNLKRIGC